MKIVESLTVSIENCQAHFDVNEWWCKFYNA